MERKGLAITTSPFLWESRNCNLYVRDLFPAAREENNSTYYSRLTGLTPR